MTGPGGEGGPGSEDGPGDEGCPGDKGGPMGEGGSGGDDGSKGEGGGPRGEVGGDVIYGGSSILGINVKKGVIYLVCFLSFCRNWTKQTLYIACSKPKREFKGLVTGLPTCSVVEDPELHMLVVCSSSVDD